MEDGMITIREVMVKFDALGRPNVDESGTPQPYIGVVRQEESYVTRVMLDLSDIAGNILSCGANVKRGDGSTNKDFGLLMCPAIQGQNKKYFLDLSEWYTNYEGNLEITIQALAEYQGKSQKFNCSKFVFAVEDAPLNPNDDRAPTFYAVYSINGRTGVVEIAPESVGSGASIVAGASEENPNKFQFKSIKGGTNINVTADDEEVTIALDSEVATDTEVEDAIDEHNEDTTAHGIDVINTALGGKVDKVEGKGLTKNELTDALKSNYDAAYTHSQSAHAPSNAQKNSDITKAEIEAKLIGEINTHSHALPNHNHDTDYYKKSETYTKTEVDSKLSAVYRFKGTRETYAQLLETVTTPNYGDTYNIQDTGDNYSWSDFGGVGQWDKLSGTVDLSNYYTIDEVDTLAMSLIGTAYTKVEIDNMIGDIETLLEGI